MSFLQLFLNTWLVQGALFLLTITLVYLVIWRWGRNIFSGSKIRQLNSVPLKQIKQEIKNTLLVLAVGSINSLIVISLYQSGHTKLYTDPTQINFLGIIVTVLAFIVFNDAWFYFIHRLLHQPWFFKRIHFIHHKSIEVNPFTSYSFHIIEATLLGLWVIPAIVLIPIYLPAIFITHIIGTYNNILSHLGYEFYPKWLLKVPVLKYVNTSTYHSLHHTNFNGNYALFFRFWDKIFGTEIKSYESDFTSRKY
jgi:sterol desaturase/sphingolipid hydroxylase (fatty acid hydroxylase superfamily)